MKRLILLMGACAGLYAFTEAPPAKKTASLPAPVENSKLQFGTQQNGGPGRMPAIIFKSQDYCRAELPEFEFEVHYTVVSATVYFTGPNFKGVEKGRITSNSLKPIRQLMDRSGAGTTVVFDDVKVKGPDHEVRSIDGLTLQLF
ncbi:MAG: hypothetical protein U0V75_09620 [Ferruginibacter sp.]